MKKVYFACSIRGGRENAEIYASMVEHIKTQAEVLTEIFADGKLTPMGMNKPSAEIWRADINWVKQADAIIAEVTSPSLGVGYEIAFAENLGTPILALYQETERRKLSAMIDGAPGVQVVRYKTLDDAQKAIDIFLKTVN